jgi:ADP-ribose pyrophosphatase YjhB (NUDIX family)
MQYNLILISFIYNQKGEILLTKRKREPGMGKWSFSGGVGALKEESDPFKAVAKEVYFDFGVEYVEYALFAMKYENKNGPILRLYFQGKINAEPQIKGLNTIAELGWFSASDVLGMELAFEEADKDVFKQFREQILSR